MVVAVATWSSVLLFDTQQRQPFASISNIHFTRITDLSWSPDDRLLCASSTDGFCSLITFSSGELGIPYVDPAEEFKENTEITKSCPAVEEDASTGKLADLAGEVKQNGEKMIVDDAGTITENNRRNRPASPVNEYGDAVPSTNSAAAVPSNSRPTHRRVALIPVAK